MKRSLTALALLTVSLSSFGQNVNKLIGQDDVTRIIKALSADDMQGRATFTPGIEKAAKFIEHEYAKTGLKPLPGNTDFRQNFSMIRSTPLKTTVAINGSSVGADSVFASASSSFNWTNNTDVQVVQVGPEKNFIQEYLAYIKSGKKMLVVVDPGFQSIFTRVRKHVLNGSASFKTENG